MGGSSNQPLNNAQALLLILRGVSGLLGRAAVVALSLVIWVALAWFVWSLWPLDESAIWVVGAILLMLFPLPFLPFEHVIWVAGWVWRKLKEKNYGAPL
jgi:hypothetical protein